MNIPLKPNNAPKEPGDYAWQQVCPGLVSKETRVVIAAVVDGPRGLGISVPGMTAPWPLSEIKGECLWSDRLTFSVGDIE